MRRRVPPSGLRLTKARNSGASNGAKLGRRLASIGDVSGLLEETINRVRRGPFDLRAANAIGFLAGILLKALDQRLKERVAHWEAVISGKGENERDARRNRTALRGTRRRRRRESCAAS